VRYAVPEPLFLEEFQLRLVLYMPLSQVCDTERPSFRYNNSHNLTVFKKKKAAAEIDDLFDDMEIVDEITAETPASSQAQASTSAGRTKTTLSVEDRKAKFDALLDFVKPRIGRKPQTNLPTVRNSAWLTLLQLAASEAELQAIVEIAPQWKERGRKFTPQFSEAFVRRCQELKCPLIALDVYGNYAKFNIPLTLPAARQLLHSLHKGPIEHVMTASALYGLYSLPAASQDYVSCAIIVDACLRHNSPDSNNIAAALLPHLRSLQESTKIDTEDTYHRENVWVQKAVKAIEGRLKKRKEANIDLSASSSAATEQTVSV